MSFAFPKSVRLRHRNDFLRLKKGSRKLFNDQFIINYKENAQKQSRLGVIVSKKVSKKAVIRNSYKRIARETFRRHQHELKPVDYLIVVRHNPSFDKMSFAEALEKAWQQLKN